ncbi:hypothetical protein GGI07_004679 [Coemansia sp. Benny D115]|nr:hypothetical protein GGI07_004679 [Coemansia sp. Benny D115]
MWRVRTLCLLHRLPATACRQPTATAMGIKMRPSTWRRSLATIQPSLRTDFHTQPSETSMLPAAEVAEPAADDAAHLAQSIREFLVTTRQRPRAGLKADELLVKCPQCSPGKPRRLAYSAHLSTRTGNYVCTSCFSQGSWDKYRELAAQRPFQNTIPRVRSTDPEPLAIADEQMQAMQENLRSHQPIWSTLVDEMKLSPDALREYAVGLGWISPGVPEIHDSADLLHTHPDDAKVPCLVFPRTAFATNTFIGKAPGSGEPRFRTVQIKTQTIEGMPDAANIAGNQTQLYFPADASQPGLFGFHLAAADAGNDVIVTGRELDAVAAYQATGIPAVSLPRGAYQLPLDAMRALERFERVYVWLDDGHQGVEASRLIARKLGVDRCLVVTGPAAAQAVAQPGGRELADILDEAQPLPHDQVVGFASLRDAVRFEAANPELIRGVPSKDLPGWNDCLKGLRPGELTILSGATGCGKTTIASQLSLDFCRSGVSTLWGSFEIPNVRLATRMVNQFARQEVPPKDIDYWSHKFEQLPMYFLKFHGSTNPKTVLETMRHAVYAYDVKHVVIDNLQFMMSMQARGFDKYDAQDAAIATFRQFATEENVHITVVAHLRKDSGGASAGASSRAAAADADINSIFGSAKVTQEADNVLILQRHGSGEATKNVRSLSVLKNRFDGTLGKVFIKYSHDTQCFDEIAAPKRPRKTIKVVKAVATSGQKLTKAERQAVESLASEESVSMNEYDDGSEELLVDQVDEESDDGRYPQNDKPPVDAAPSATNTPSATNDQSASNDPLASNTPPAINDPIINCASDKDQVDIIVKDLVAVMVKERKEALDAVGQMNSAL